VIDVARQYDRKVAIADRSMIEKTMGATPAVQTTEQGILLPRQLFDAMGEVEVVQRDNYILIKPKNMTLRFKGFIHPHVSVESLHEDYESSLLRGADP